MRPASILLISLLAAPAAPASRAVAQLPSTWRADLLAVRESAWRHFFGNPDGLAALLTDDFVAIDDGGNPWTDKPATLAQSREVTKAGTTIATIEFPDNVIQQYGTVAIIYSTYAYATTTAGAKSPIKRGRATELFRWDGRRWLHTGWHLSSSP
jgi:ketosteroid isomerase-like protein